MIQLSEHFTYKKLLRFTISPIVMMVINSIYGVVDGLFMSNFVGKTAFAAVNFIWPYLMILGGIGFMFGTGGSALIAKTLGERNDKKANEIFSMLFYVSVISGIFLMVFGLLTIRPVAVFFGAEGTLLDDALLYGRLYMLGIPASVIQYEFQNIYSAAGKPKLGLAATVASGITNIVLDALFVVGFSWGLAGAAIATVTSQVIGGALPILYFSRENSSSLRFGRAAFNGRAILQICANGSSELLNNISMSIVSMLYNVQLLSYAGSDGVAAYGVLMYMDFMFLAVFIGYTVGVSPIISFHYGAQNHAELKSLLHKSLVIIGSGSFVMFLLSEFLARPVSLLFVGYDPGLLDMTLHGFLLYSFCFLFAGMGIFSSSFFTALNNGLLSAILSFTRTMIFQVGAILILPLIWELDGIWLSVVAADLLAALLGCIFILCFRKKYGY